MKLLVLLSATGLLMTAAATAETKLDTDGDGAVSREEFTQGHLERAEERFARLDANTDGKLTQEELQALRERFVMRRGESRPRIDTDGDGAWSLPELQTVRPGMTAEQFNRLDSNADGLLQSDERPHRGSFRHRGPAGGDAG